MTARRFAFHVEYDGTDFHGWQAQPGLRTVQEALQIAAAELLGTAPDIDGASRTDAGVHARDQLAALTHEHPISPAGFVKALNSRLPRDVAVRDAFEVAADFEPRFANHGKTYCYRIYQGLERRPLIDRYAWRVHWWLDQARLAAGAAHLVGTHDFTSFAATGGGHRSAVRTVIGIDAAREAAGVLAIEVRGTAFLQHMVRNLVGTLVEVARGQRDPAEMAVVLAARDRRTAGPTAPARGLTLERVWLDAPRA